MKISPSMVAAGLAGAFAGITMPLLWPRLVADSMLLVLAFLLVVALPAHAFVVGFGRERSANGGGIDLAMLKRVAVWLATALAAAAASKVLSA